MTIKEKARIAWEKDLEVKITVHKGIGFTGKMRSCYSRGVGIPNGPDSWETIEYGAIADIQFVNFPARDIHNAIHAKLSALSDRVDDLEGVKALHDTSKLIAKMGKLENELRAVVKKVVLGDELVCETVDDSESTPDRMTENELLLDSLKSLGIKVKDLDQEIQEPTTMAADEKPHDIQDGMGWKWNALECALIGRYGVAVGWSNDGGFGRVYKCVRQLDRTDGKQTVTFVDSTSLDLDDIYSIEASTQDAQCVDEKPYDIAKERWKWVEVSKGSDPVLWDAEGEQVDALTPERKALQAAAPELADLMREEVNGVIPDLRFRGDLDYHVAVVERIRLLRSLGVPDVAPWYKE